MTKNDLQKAEQELKDASKRLDEARTNFQEAKEIRDKLLQGEKND